jgi:hypothetical protein
VLLMFMAAPTLAADQTHTVDTWGGAGLLQVALILQARTGATFSFEGVPRNVQGLHYTPTARPDGTVVNKPQHDADVRFSYPAAASPREIAEAAVATYNGQSTAYAHYKVVEHSGALNLVPTEILTASGWAAYDSLMDTVITLPSSTGHPTELYHSVVKVLSETAGVPVQDLDGRTLSFSSSPVTLSARTAPARVLLDELVSRSDLVNHWRLTWAIPQAGLPHHGLLYEGWTLSLDLVQPEHDSAFNRTPLVPRQADK